MGTTAQKLNKILETKEAIRTAINNKGGTLTTTDTFASYPTAIDNLSSGGGNVNPLQYIIDNHKGDGQASGEYLFYEYWGSSLDDAINSCDFSKITSANNMFYDCKNLTSIPYFDTSNVKNANHMFYQCKNLLTIPQFNTSNITETSYMFHTCENLTSIPQLDTSKVRYMTFMFYYCKNLTTIPKLNTNRVENMERMFSYCVKLKTIDITHMNITSIYNSNSFASNCYSLTKLIIRNMTTIPVLASNAFGSCYHFTGTTNANYNPQGLKDGRIYVPDDKVESLKTATNWSVYADIIVPLSTLVE